MSKAGGSAWVDDAVQAFLPEGTKVTEVIPWGSSGWTETRRVSTVSPDGEETEYFLKSSNADVSGDMFKGEYFSLDKMHQLMPEACPKPFGWGEFKSSPGTFFVLMEFLYLIPKEPGAAKISQMISSLHKATSGTSPDLQFGFYVPTCHGRVLQPNTWKSDWMSYFKDLITLIYTEDITVNGPLPEYDEAFTILAEETVPRLLGVLTADGRKIVPCLVHGDLWQQNIGINEDTDEPMIYDPGLFYAHNEFEIGMWRTSFVHFDESYRKQYAHRMPPSEPTEEWDDRNRLYCLFFHISHSAHWPATSGITRRLCLNDMHYLNEKYATRAKAL